MNGRTAVYLRVSTGEQRLDAQRLELERHCRLRGWADLRLYEEKACGAKASRPVLDRLMADVRAGGVKRLVCYKLDRLGRSLTHLALILEELNRLRVPLVCASQGIDTSEDNPAGRLQLGVLMAVAEFERGIIRERVSAGLAAARRRGVCSGRPRRLDAHREAGLRLRAEGMAIRPIARRLGLPMSSVYSVVRDNAPRTGSEQRTSGG